MGYCSPWWSAHYYWLVGEEITAFSCPSTEVPSRFYNIDKFNYNNNKKATTNGLHECIKCNLRQLWGLSFGLIRVLGRLLTLGIIVIIMPFIYV